MVVVSRRRVALLAFAVAYVTAAGGAAPEYEVKAAFLYNFAKFVEWPAEAFTGRGAFRFCILGDDPFGTALERTVAGKRIDDHPIEIARHDAESDATECHVVFLGVSEASTLRRTLATLGARGILTVGDRPEFVDDGTVIGFRLEGDRVRFDINADAAERAGLRVSSQLMKLASRVVR
jgi:hypothetical protein